MIMGRDVMNEFGIVLDFTKKTMTWDKLKIAMCTCPQESTTKTITEQ